MSTNNKQHSYASVIAMFEKQFAIASENNPVIDAYREPSLNERQQIFHPAGYYKFFCIHDRHLFVPCKTCKRTEQDGVANQKKFINEVEELSKWAKYDK